MPKDGKPPKLPPGFAPKPKARKMPPGFAALPRMPPGRPARKVVLPAGGDGAPTSGLKRKDFSSDQDVRWCPGCGDYAILASVQRLLPKLGIPKAKLVFISGIGCSSRFPYYMNTYGMHTIHGRAPTFATGLKASRPDLDVWIVTGDGDALSIGGNHLIHVLRRNLNVQILLFNNQVYGLTKGQFSPTSEIGKVTKSTPYGSLSYPFNPVSVALGAEASFVARTLDRDVKHMTGILQRAHTHTGAAFVEIYQNCNIYNDGAFFDFTEKATKAVRTVRLQHGKPMVYDNGNKAVRLDGFRSVCIDLTSGDWSVDDAIVYDESSSELAGIASRMSRNPDLPRPIGVFFSERRDSFETLLHRQIEFVIKKRGKGDLDALLRSGDTWEVA